MRVTCAGSTLPRSDCLPGPSRPALLFGPHAVPVNIGDIARLLPTLPWTTPAGNCDSGSALVSSADATALGLLDDGFPSNERELSDMGASKSHAGYATNPIDLVEQLAQNHEWSVERIGDDELTLIVSGDWTDYHVSVNWREDLEALHLACAFDFKVPETRLPEMYRLTAQINEQLWLGHFDLWAQEGLIMFRHALLLNGTLATPGQCEAMLRAALEACERYYQAFQFVVWAGRESHEALASAMFETEGRAQ